MRNQARGETLLEAAGRKYVLRPSFEVMEIIEDATGVSIPGLINEMATGLPKFSNVVTILWVAASKNQDNEGVGPRGDFGEMLREEFGLMKATRLASDFLIRGIASKKDLEEKLNDAEGDKDADPTTPPKDKAQKTKK